MQRARQEQESAASSSDAGVENAVQELVEAPLRHFDEVPNRWYRDPWSLLPPPAYEINEPGNGFDPYRQNVLKGDFPIFGDDVFLRLTLTEKLVAEGRRVPTPRGITGPGPNNASFFGDGDQFQVSSKTALSIDLFKGQEAFKPVDFRIRITPVFDITHLDVQELGAVNINVESGTSRTTDDIALQEALIEIHLFDLNSRYDFISSEVGIFPFRSDFRGFIFDDVNLGLRLFGTADQNKWQYNLVFFNMLEKDTNSELNRLEERDQQVLIANVYRQDFFVLGYTAQFSFHWNHDKATTHFNRNGFLVRPQPIGLTREKALDSFYFGWTGEGHFGRLNVTHAFYQVIGEEETNALAGRSTDINAQFAALELSVDVDWMRFRAFAMYASGDDDARDGDAEGFDAIMDAANFAGGEFSLFNRQQIQLLGVALTPRLSFLPDLTSSKQEGQSNFVNPGLLLVGGAFDAEITPTWRAQIGASYLRFIEEDPLEVYLELEDIDQEIGVEVFFGTTYRPLLTNNIIINVGASVLFPGEGLQKIYQSDDVLYSVFFDLTLTY
ncbi:MAG: hypothetical protein KDB53_19990 [Planctomycetes bacterium]|nr:hypothetical protein [Planctomycetota bacterium]